MQPGKALVGGILAGASVTLLTSLARAVSIPVNGEMWLGSLLTAETSALTWVLGFVLFLGLSAVAGLVYGVVFEHLAHRANAPLGMGLSLIHLVVSGIALGSLAYSHPLMPLYLDDPGRFASQLGPAATLVFALSHLVFGAVMGWVYPPVLEQNRGGEPVGA